MKLQAAPGRPSEIRTALRDATGKLNLRILLLEDCQDDADLILATLAKAAIDCSDAVRVETEADFVGELEKGGFDLILADHSLPLFDGLSALNISLSKSHGVPFIFVSGSIGEEAAIETLKSGATDYVLKWRLSRLAPAVRRAIAEVGERAARQDAEKAVAERSRELADAHARLTILDRSKDDFLRLISHEFRTPLNGLLGASELILDAMPRTAENDMFKGLFERSRRKMITILDDALLLTHIDVSGELFRSVPIALAPVLKRALQGAVAFAESCDVALSAPPPDLTCFVLANQGLLERALQALLETAVKFSAKWETVGVSCEVARDSRRLVVIESLGRSIPKPALPKFFDLFSIADSITPGGDLGLGAPTAQRILALFDASVSVANRDPSGIRLTISLKEC